MQFDIPVKDEVAVIYVSAKIYCNHCRATWTVFINPIDGSLQKEWNHCKNCEAISKAESNYSKMQKRQEDKNE